MDTEPANQWCSEILRPALELAIECEMATREMVNNMAGRGARLSLRPAAVERDVLTNFLRMCLPASTDVLRREPELWQVDRKTDGR